MGVTAGMALVVKVLAEQRAHNGISNIRTEFITVMLRLHNRVRV